MKDNTEKMFRRLLRTKCVSVFFLLCVFKIHASDSETLKPGRSEAVPGRWTVETSLTFPINRIYMGQFGFRLGQYGELLFGPCFQNWKDEGEAKGTAHAYTFISGYRQYIWNNIHGEAELFSAYNSFNSSVDGKTYNGMEVWIEYRLGWKYVFKVGDLSLFLIPQPSMGHAIFLQHIWPGLDENTYRWNSITFIPQLIFGINL